MTARQLVNEASATRRSNPLDICASTTFRDAFRAALHSGLSREAALDYAEHAK